MDANAFFMGPHDPSGKLAKNHVSPPPLTLDRVMENRPFRSDSPLFALPVEILALIFQFVDDASLSSLAFVNGDFRNFVRSRQFSSVHLDYSLASEALVNYLHLEAHERFKNNGPPVSSSLGACIRRLTVATSLKELRERFDLPDAFELSGRSDADTASERDALREHYLEIVREQEPRWENADAMVQNEYIPKIEMILSALPHLETLAWEEENIYLSTEFFSTLACSSIRHLKLCRPEITEEVEIRLPTAWPLQTLHVEFASFDKAFSPALFCSSILRLCASTLETLLWTDMSYSPRGISTGDLKTFDRDAPTFPRLRNLSLSHRSLGTSVMEAFLKSQLENLTIRLTSDGIDESLDSHGYIPSLKMFSDFRSRLNFLRANRHLSKIDFGECGIDSLETEALPLLSTFFNLKSLRVYWPGDCSKLPETGLRLLGNLRTLHQLCIVCGRPGVNPTWVVDHEAIRKHLASLSHLKKLAINNDTYESDIAEPIRYYRDTYATSDDILPEGDRTPFFSAKAGRPHWEKRHRARMMVEVEKYLEIFPDLEWIYLGQLAIRIELMPGPNPILCRSPSI